MRFKVFSLFLAVLLASFALWQGTHAWDKKATPTPIMIQPEDAMATASHQAAKPSIKRIRFSAKTVEGEYELLATDRKEGLLSVMAQLPSEHTSSLKNLVLDYDPKAYRGLGGRSLIILRAVDMDTAEQTAVLIHEIGHNVDLGVMAEKSQETMSEFRDGKSAVYESDPSLGFYRLSWDSEKTRKKTATNFDFVSGYAMSDPFEDFAEGYVYYVLHNQDFKSKAQTSDVLWEKYKFIRDVVFKGEIFATGEYKPEALNQRPWDITVLSYDLNGFLGNSTT